MTAPAGPSRTATAVRRRGLPVGAAVACVSALVALGISACAGGDGEPASGNGGSSTSSSSTTATSESTTTETGPAGGTTENGPSGGSTTETAPGHGTAETGSSSGSTTETVPGVPGDVAGPVAIDAAADFGDGVEVRLSRIEAVEAEATLPGEVSGPAVAVTVEVTNGSGDAIDLDHVTVDLATASGASASPVLDPDRDPLAGGLDADDTRSGTYVFTLANEERADVSARVRYSASAPTVVFTGSVPSA